MVGGGGHGGGVGGCCVEVGSGVGVRGGGVCGSLGFSIESLLHIEGPRGAVRGGAGRGPGFSGRLR